MIIYGIKTVDLNTIDLPIACTECGHDHQSLQIYRNFFSLYFIPVIPLHKSGVITCPLCSRQLQKKSFLKELAAKGLDSMQTKLHLNSIFKAVRTPLRMYAAPLLLAIAVITFFAYSFYQDRQEKELAKKYLQNPVGNVITVLKSIEDSTYPYLITYIAEVSDDTSVVFDWKYSYESLSGANREIDLAYASISKNKFIDDFNEPYLVHTEDIKTSDIVRVHPLNKSIDWKAFAPLPPFLPGINN